MFGTNRFGDRVIVEEYEIAAGFDWSNKKRAAAMLRRINALLDEANTRGRLILVWLSEHVFVASNYTGEVQNFVLLFGRPVLIADQPRAHEGINERTVTFLHFVFPGSETVFYSYAVGADPFLKLLAVDKPLQECLGICFNNKELSALNGHVLGLFVGILWLWRCTFVDGGIAFVRSLRDNPNQGPRRIEIVGSLILDSCRRHLSGDLKAFWHSRPPSLIIELCYAVGEKEMILP